MTLLLDNAYLQTRLTLLTGRLLSSTELKQMITGDLDKVISHIQSIMPDKSQQLTSDRLETALNQSMHSDFQILLRPFHGAEYRFLRQAVRWFELINLKVLIRGKFTGVRGKELSSQMIELGVFSDLPLQTLIETDDPYEMLRLLESTAYGGIVRHARRVYEEQGHELFVLDSAIDRDFFIELSTRSKDLNTSDQLQLKQVFGVLMDRFNLLWLVRYRFSYGLSAAKSFYLLSSTGNQLHSSHLLKLAKLGSLQKMLTQLPEKLQNLLQDVEGAYHLEQLMELYSLSAAKKGLEQRNGVITRVFSYLLLREAETRYLIAIIKGKQLGFNEELIARAIGE